MNDLSIQVHRTPRPLRKTARVIIIRDDGRVCLIERKTRSKGLYSYDFPGGGQEEADRNMIDTAKREALEEVGIIIDNVRPMNFVSRVHHVMASKERAKLFSGTESNYYFADYVSEDKSVMEPLRGATISWLLPKEVVNRLAFAEYSVFNASRMEAINKFI